MISEKVVKGLNDQLNKELFSSYLYLSMAAYLENTGFNGCAKWMRLQSDEEYAHAMKFFDYIIQAGAKVELEAIEKPKTDWDSPKNIFEEALEHEKFITDSINQLAGSANRENDFATLNFLNWFVSEQIEEIATVTTIVDNFKMIGDDTGALFMLDRELGARTSNAPQQ